MSGAGFQYQVESVESTFGPLRWATDAAKIS